MGDVIVRLTREARSDLDEIYEHYKDLLGADQAEAVVHDVVLESKTLNTSSLITKNPPPEASPVRALVLQRWPFVTTYHVAAGSVEILRFLQLEGQTINPSLYHQREKPTTSPASVAGLRSYEKVVDGITYNVPRGIIRESRGDAWIVRVIRDKQLVMSERFSDLRFGGTSQALKVAIGYLTYSGHASPDSDVLHLNDRTTVHWRKRSGAGLCAVAYVSNKGSGRGETFFLSTYKRIASGKGMDKFRSKMLTVLEHAYKVENDAVSVPQTTLKEMNSQLDQLWIDVSFSAFLEAGNKKADQIAVSEYLENHPG